MLHIYNSLTRKKDPFTPITPGKVRLYVCGMTVYDLCHLGHARSMLAFDVVQRWLKATGYRVTYVRNVTDIDDKIIARAIRNGETITALTNRMVDALHQDADALGIEINGALVKASEFSSSRLGLKNARFVRESFWKSDVSDRTIVFLYQVPYAMRKLETKLQQELPLGARVISNDFKFVNWKPSEEHGRIRIYVKSEVA